MTKTLTEQWREGTLPLNHYYVKTKSGRYGINHTVLSFDGDKPRTRLEYSDRTEEVLASVPSYEDYKDLYDSNKQLMAHIKTCEQQIERLQEQLNEANEVIKKYMSVAFGIRNEEEKPTVLQLAFDYLENWGVK